MKHVMVDIEVLGVIASIGAVKFTEEDQHTRQFYRVIDISTGLLAGLEFEPSTVEFWKKQDPEAIGPLLNNRSKVSLHEALSDFSKFVDHKTYLWAKGPDYDIVYLRRAYDAVGLKHPWFYRNVRCVRTVVGLAETKYVEAETKHDALDDAIAQARSVVRAYQKLGLKL